MQVGTFQLDQFKILNHQESRYFISHPTQIGDFKSLESRDLALVTVLTAPSEDSWADGAWPLRRIKKLRAEDDVWSDDFLSGIFINISTSHPPPGSNEWNSLRNELQKLTSWHVITRIEGRNQAQDGPHLLSHGQLSAVSRICDDDNGCFMVPLVAKDADSLEPFRVTGYHQQSLGVCVPSRAASTAKGFISGKRIAVKEVFQIAGITAALTNRAFYDVSTPAESTAPAIQRLISLGSVILGTAKCSSMITREQPVEAIDYQSPWNPRADLYQSPVASSSGSAAGIAAYPWLDFTIGTDTTGSSRLPAFVNGCFQVRISKDKLPLGGILPCFEFFDAIAVFSRCIDGLHSFVSNWLDEASHTISKPTRIVFPTEYQLSSENEAQNSLINKAINDITNCFGISVRHVSLEELWTSNPPVEAEGQNWKEYLKDVGLNSFIYGYAHRDDDFREVYRKKHGREPFVTKTTRWRWDVGCAIPKAKHEDAMQKILVYRSWLMKHVMQAETETTIVALPLQKAVPIYRDVDPGEPWAAEVWDQYWMSPVLGGPDVTTPIGELEFQSRISRIKEKLPVGLSWVGAPGTDVSLLHALKVMFASSRRPLSVFTGREMYRNMRE